MTQPKTSTAARLGALGAAVVAAILGVTACGSSGDGAGSGGGGGGGSYTIAALLDLTGTYAQAAGSVSSGMQAMVKWANAQGGRGKKIEINTIDTQSTDSGNVAGMQKAIPNEPIAMMQGGNSSYAAILPLIKQAGTIPFFTAGATDNTLYPPVSNVFMAQASAKQQATALFNELKTSLGSLAGKKVSFLGLTSAYTDGMVQTITGLVAQAGGSVADHESFPITTVSFGAQASKIANGKPDAVIFLGATADSAEGLKSLVNAGITAPILTYSSGSSNPILTSVGAPNVTGLRTTVVPDPGTPIRQAAETAGYSDKAVDDNFSLGWAEAATIVGGLDKCGDNCTSTKLLDTLQSLGSLPLAGSPVFAPVSISATNHAILTSAQFYKFSNGQIVKNGDPVSLGS